MKIRTDFVTNSSSSCFCVQLLLQFDNQDALYMDANSQKGDPDVYFDFADCKIIHAFSGKGLYTHDLAKNFSELIRYREDLPNLFRVASDMASGGLRASVVEQVCSTATKLDHAYLVAHADVEGEYSYIGETYSMLDIDVKNAYVDTRSEEENLQMLKSAGLEPLGDEALEELIQGQFSDENGGRHGLSKTIEIHMTPDGSVSADIYQGYCRDCLGGIRISPEHDIAAMGRYPSRMKAACKAGKSLQDMIEAARESIFPRDFVRQDAFKEVLENLDRNAVVAIAGNHFALSGFGDYAEELTAEIEKRGGFVHSTMGKKVNYLVMCLESPSSASVRKALEWRKQGVYNLIVSDYQLWQALLGMTDNAANAEDPFLKIRLEQEKQLKKREEERARIAAENKLRREEERRKAAEERARLAEENKLRLQEERRRAAEEKLRLKVEREKEWAEKKRTVAAETKAQMERERQEDVANATILYAPGQEPDNIRRRIRILCEKLDAAYPDRVITGLYIQHKNWGETVTELRRILGYPDNTSFLEAYGYTVETSDNKGGHPTTVNPDEVIAELKRRYPNGAGPVKLAILQKDNPDLPWKTLQNNAIAYFGETLVAYLKAIGIVGGAEIHTPILEGNRDQQQKREESEENRLAPIESIEISKPAEIQPFEQQNLGPLNVELTAAELRCIEAIKGLEQMGMPIRSVDVANKLGVTQPAVTRQVKNLCEKGVLSKSERGILSVHMPDKTGGKPATPPKTDRELMVKYGLTRSEIACYRAFETCKAASHVVVKNVDIANILGISQARVSIMMSKIRKTGLLSEGSAKANAEGPVVQGEDEEKARREAEENARREAEENARREAEEKARREAEEKARREAAPRPASAANASQRVKNSAYSKPGTPNTIRRRQLKAEIHSLEAERDALQGPLDDMKRRELQEWIDELRAELEQLS